MKNTTTKKRITKTKSSFSNNKEFKTIKCRLGEPMISVEMDNSILTTLKKVAEDEFNLILLSRNAGSLKNIATLKKLWVDKFFNALCLETLGRIRSKFSGNLPIPGAEITLNSENLRIDSYNEIQHLRMLLYESIENRLKKNSK